MATLQQQGFKVQPFKCGPDYIDPKFHGIACGSPSVNLDGVMMTATHLKATYLRYAKNADITITEGVMGLFDGAVKSEGSTASLSKELGIPVLLIVDAKAVAYSVAPLLYGFRLFDDGLTIGGVVFNRVASRHHYQFLKDACDEVGIDSFGYLPEFKGASIPSRHLGLSLGHLRSANQGIKLITKAIAETVQWQPLLETFTTPLPRASIPPTFTTGKKIRAVVAHDDAFNFTYLQNLDKLQQHASLTTISPLQDRKLPPADLLYLPGGYPELYAGQLAKNKEMLRSVHNFISKGGSVLAECGGLMYLGETLTDKQGEPHKMVGALPLETSMEAMKLNLGYRKIQLGKAGLTGHEFHYSMLSERSPIPCIGTVRNMRGKILNTKVFHTKNIIASYIHLYFGEQSQFQEIIKLLNLII